MAECGIGGQGGVQRDPGAGRIRVDVVGEDDGGRAGERAEEEKREEELELEHLHWKWCFLWTCGMESE